MDLLDFYRGTLSARRLGVLVRHLSVDSALVRAVNGGRKPWGNIEHLLADLWALFVNMNRAKNAPVKDHPTRAAMEKKASAAANMARLTNLKAEYEQRKRDRSRRKAV